MYKLRYNARIGMILLGICLVTLGINMFYTGHQFYGPYFHAYRRMILPELSNKLTPTLTYDDLVFYLLRFHSFLTTLAGCLFIYGDRLFAPAILCFEMEFMIVALDNPWLGDYMKPKPKNNRYRYDLLFKHISMFGLAVLIMCSPPAKTREEEENEDREHIE